MMKGSTNTQGGGSYGAQSGGPQKLSMDQITNFYTSGPGATNEAARNPINALMGYFFPGYGSTIGMGGAGSGTGTKGSTPQQQMSLPSMPEYVNYQQTPVYSSQPAAPSDAITRFMSGYASGGSVEPDVNASLEEDIKAALRLARLIGELTKKE